MRGHEVKVKFFVDPEGRPVSVLILGSRDANYGTRLADELLAGVRFRPLREGACRVYALTTLTMHF
jgi:hypothetical protein